MEQNIQYIARQNELYSSTIANRFNNLYKNLQQIKKSLKSGPVGASQVIPYRDTSAIPRDCHDDLTPCISWNHIKHCFGSEAFGADMLQKVSVYKDTTLVDKIFEDYIGDFT